MSLKLSYFSSFALVGLLLFFSISCETSAPGKSQRVLLPWLDESGTYTLQEIPISGLYDSKVLSSANVSIHYNSEDSEPVRPKFSESKDGLIIPSDVNSALAYAAFAHFSDLKKKEDEWGVSHLTSWPKKVSIDVRTGKEANNAFYKSLNNGGTVGIEEHKGLNLPIAFNRGILAHENFHSYFDELFIKRIGNFKRIKLTIDDEEALDDKKELSVKISAVDYNRGYIFRAWNEGLADFFGFVHTRDNAYMADSFPWQLKRRSLSEKEYPLVSNRNFIAFLQGDFSKLVVFDKEISSRPIGDYRCRSVGCSYLLGTQIARFLHRIALENPQWGNSNFDSHEVLLKYILNQLPVLASKLKFPHKIAYVQLGVLLNSLFEGSPFIKDISCNELHRLTRSSGIKRKSKGCKK